jgi:hypothetical protein
MTNLALQGGFDPFDDLACDFAFLLEQQHLQRPAPEEQLPRELPDQRLPLPPRRRRLDDASSQRIRVESTRTLRLIIKTRENRLHCRTRNGAPPDVARRGRRYTAAAIVAPFGVDAVAAGSSAALRLASGLAVDDGNGSGPTWNSDGTVVGFSRGNILGEPRFADRAGHDYHLLLGSA